VLRQRGAAAVVVEVELGGVVRDAGDVGFGDGRFGDGQTGGRGRLPGLEGLAWIFEVTV
jgi:hypothetical protein